MSARPAADVSPAEPLTISVNQELNDGEHLRISATVTSLVDWPADQAEVNLVTMHGDQILEQRRMRLSALISTSNSMLSADQSYGVLLDLPAKGADNYQLSLLWGNEAQAPEKANFKITKVEHQKLECNPDCKEKLNIIGELINSSTSQLSSAELRIELYKAQALDLRSRTPENVVADSVQSLNVNGLTLAPGAQRKMKLVLDTPIAIASDGAENVPLVKVVKVND